MTERDLELRDFENRLSGLLHDYAQAGVQPIDAIAIARRAAGNAARPALPRVGRPALGALRLLLVGALLVVVTIGAAFAGGLLPLPGPTPSPSPSPTSAVPSPTAPGVTPTPPATPLTPTAPPTLGAWQALTDFPLERNEHVAAITAGGPGFVAVGWRDASGAIADAGNSSSWTSADGVTWTHASAFEGARMKLVAANGGTIFAIGPIPSSDPDYPELGQARLWSSTDGLGWQQPVQPAAFAGAIVQSLVAADGVLVAGGYRDAPGHSVAVIWTSTNGTDWTEVPGPPELLDVQRLAVGSGYVIALGNDGGSPPWRSLWYADAPYTDWQRADAPDLDKPDVTIMDIAAGPTGAIAAGTNDSPSLSGFVLSSTDGRTWSVPALQPPPGPIERVLAVPGGKLFFGNHQMWSISHGDGGLYYGWTSVDAPPTTVSGPTAIGVGPTGVLVANYGVTGGVWFAPFGR